MELELAVDLDIKEYNDTTITKYDSGLTNAIVRVADNKVEITQRPSIDITEDASGIAGIEARARGIYYWEENAKIYIVNDNDIFESTQDSTRIAENTGTFGTGTEKVTILETIATPKLIFIDAENNKLFVMTAAKVLDQVTTNVPATIVHGGAFLNQQLFIMDEDGAIYNSDADAPQTFGALSFLNAERDADKGVYLGKHRDHIVAFGTRTIEFFFYSGGASGSPLTRRNDIFHSIGCADGLGVWENGDNTFFVGSSDTGDIAVYELASFQVRPISSGSLNSFLKQATTNEDVRLAMTGFSAQGRPLVILHIYVLTGGNVDPKETLLLDPLTKKWGFIRTTINGNTLFPAMALSRRTGGQNATVKARITEGIMNNGDIFNIVDNDSPIDTLLASSGVFESDVFEPGIFDAGSGGSSANIDMVIRTGMQDFGYRGQKFQNFEYVELEDTAASQTLTVKHSDESIDSFGTGETVDLSQTRKEIYAGGSFVRRNYQLEYSGNEQIAIEGFGADVEPGD